MEYIETEIKDAFGMTFRVHTTNLFKELWECSGMKIYGKIMKIFLALLNDVAQRATEINDPVMNALILKLRLYEVQQESDIPKLIDKMKEEYEQSKLLNEKAEAENEKLKKELSRCRAANADYLTKKTEAENEVKILKQEVADLKVPESRQNRHLRDELKKVRLECQQAWECAEKERKGYNEVKKDILTLITLIPCNEENESIINDMKNLLK